MYLLFLAVWLILNGKVTAEILVFGIVISAALFAFTCRFLDYSLRKEILLFHLIPFFIRYLWVLVKEIFKANMCVLKIIFSLDLQPEPGFVYFDTSFKTGTAKMLLANSITLTPGTITVSMDEEECVVHCLDKSLSEGMGDSVFVKMLEKLERIGE